MRFGELESQKPPAFAVVRPEAFDARWEDRPNSDVAIGLRPIAHEDVKGARAIAAKRANEAHPNVQPDDDVNFPIWVEAFNDELMAWHVARAICEVNDVTATWKPFEANPEDMVRQYMTSGGIRYLYDRYEKMRIETDPIAAEATDEELAELPALLSKLLPACGRIRSSRVRRLIAFAIEELRGVETIPAPAPSSAPP